MAKEPREDGVSAPPPKRREIKLRTGPGNEVVDYTCEIRADGSMRFEAKDEADHARLMATLKEAKEPPAWVTQVPAPPAVASTPLDKEGLAGALEQLGASLVQSLSAPAVLSRPWSA